MIVFVDCETTGTDPQRHEIWEVSAIAVDEQEILTKATYDTFVRPEQLGTADSQALRINRFYERFFAGGGRTMEPRAVANELAVMLSNVTLAGFNPAFDAAFLTALFHRHDLTPAWNYHVLDIRAYAAGAFHMDPLTSSTADYLTRSGVDLGGMSLRHTAQVDAEFSYRVYKAARFAHFAPEDERSVPDA